jgi:RNA-directed DNA polymerase
VAPDWDAVDWRAAEDQVRRLRQRIFAATAAGDYGKVRSLQRLMLRSLSNTLVSVRQVTERNAGRLTPGVDRRVVLSAEDKQDLVAEVARTPLQARPVRRVFIPKANGKLRPLGIPVIADRARQAVVRNALEPEWEARFEPRSYGFRPGRGCHDAIEAIYQVVKGKDPKRQWILDADLQGAFDHIDHGFVLGQLGAFPGRGAIRAWLTAGVMAEGRFAPTEEGAPQGGVFTPPTQWITRRMVTLRVRLGVVLAGAGAASAGGDAVADGDLLGSDEDVFDQQPQYALAVFDGGLGGAGAQPGQEAFQVVG